MATKSKNLPQPDNSATLFVNWTNEDFTWDWDGSPTTIKAGDSIYFEAWKAQHFAKHLTDREMNKKGILTNDPRRTDFYSKCFKKADEEIELAATEEATDEKEVEEKADDAKNSAMNKNEEIKNRIGSKAKRGRPKRVEEVEEEKEEEEFEGLN